MEMTTFDFGDVCIGTLAWDGETVDAHGVVAIGRRAALELNEAAPGRLSRIANLEPGFLTYVGADGLRLTDADYKAIASLSGLRSLDFDNTAITAEQVAYFCQDGLLAISLATETVTDASMEAIASVRTLRSLFLSRSSITDSGFAALADHPSLESIHVSSTRVGFASAAVIASLPQLKTLEMESADDDVLVAASRPHTEYLHLKTGRVTSRGVDALVASPALTWLGFVQAKLHPSACRSLAKLPAIETLILNMSEFDDDALADGLSGLTTLYALVLRNTRVGDAVFRGVSGLPSLGTVHAQNSRITDEGVAHLAACPSLQNVDFDGTAVTSEGLAKLTQLPKPFELA